MATFPLHRPLTVLAMLGAVVLLVITWSRVVTTISNVQPAPPQTRPTAIVWANRVFSNAASLRRWLHSRGDSYSVWSRHHPQQAAILEHRPAPQPVKPRVTVTAPVKAHPQPPTRTRATQSHPTPAAGGRVIRDVVFTLLLVLAFVLAFAAALPAPLRRRFPAVAFRVAHYRGALAGGAAAIVLGVAVSVGLS